MKPQRTIQIKIWPEVVSSLPAIIPFERVAKNKLNPINIDFGNVNDADAPGLAILLGALIKIVRKTENKWDGVSPEDSKIAEKLKKLNFFSTFFKNIPNYSLFWQGYSESYNDVLVIRQESYITKEYPIYELDFVESLNRRDTVDVYKKYLIDKLFFLQDKYNFEVSVLIQILIEMAKNSADHTEDNAYFGIKIIEASDLLKIDFSFVDLGIGINQQIRQFIKDEPGFKNKANHLALTDSYHWALKVGNSTKSKSGINKGIGMYSIFDLSKQINLKLSVFDAESRGVLSNAKDISHTELRKAFYQVGFKVGFGYSGQIQFPIS